MGADFQNYKQESIQELDHPGTFHDVFYVPQWWWTGVFVPIVIAWIINRKIKANRNNNKNINNNNN